MVGAVVDTHPAVVEEATCLVEVGVGEATGAAAAVVVAMEAAAAVEEVEALVDEAVAADVEEEVEQADTNCLCVVDRRK